MTVVQLKVRLNSCDYPVFVESFDKKQVEKTRLSFSTKIPEYLSLRKPIIAIGPRGIGSMDCLSKVAICINNVSEMKSKIRMLINYNYDAQKYVKASEEEYLRMMRIDGLEKYLE